MDVRLSKLQETVAGQRSLCPAVHGVAVSTGALYFLVWLQVTVQYSLFQPGVLPLTFLIGLLTVSFLRFHPSESVIISSSFLKREGCPRW